MHLLHTVSAMDNVNDPVNYSKYFVLQDGVPAVQPETYMSPDQDPRDQRIWGNTLSRSTFFLQKIHCLMTPFLIKNTVVVVLAVISAATGVGFLCKKSFMLAIIGAYMFGALIFMWTYFLLTVRAYYYEVRCDQSWKVTRRRNLNYTG